MTVVDWEPYKNPGENKLSDVTRPDNWEEVR